MESGHYRKCGAECDGPGGLMKAYSPLKEKFMRTIFRVLGPLLAGTALTLGCGKPGVKNHIDEKTLVERREGIEKARSVLRKEMKDSRDFFERCRKSGLSEKQIQSMENEYSIGFQKRVGDLQDQAVALEELIKER